MLVILLNCITLGMFQPCVDDKCEKNRCKILQVSRTLQLKSSYFYRTCWMKIDFIFLPEKSVFMPKEIKENCKNISSKLWLIFLGPMPVTFMIEKEEWRVKHDTNFYAFPHRKKVHGMKKTVINSRLYVNFMQKYKLPNQRSAVHYESVYLSAV